MCWTSLACQIGWALFVTSKFFPIFLELFDTTLPLSTLATVVVKNKKVAPQKLKCVLIKSNLCKRQGQHLWLKHSLCVRHEVFWVLCSGLIKWTGLCASHPTLFYKHCLTVALSTIRCSKELLIHKRRTCICPCILAVSFNNLPFSFFKHFWCWWKLLIFPLWLEECAPLSNAHFWVTASLLWLVLLPPAPLFRTVVDVH